MQQVKPDSPGDPVEGGAKTDALADPGPLTYPALELQGVWAGYNHQPVLEDVSFQVAQGEILGIIGPNGSGKSTLMKAVLGLVKPWRGRILAPQSGPG